MKKYALEKSDDSATVFKFQMKQNHFPLSHMLKFLYVGAVTLVNVPYKTHARQYERTFGHGL